MIKTQIHLPKQLLQAIQLIAQRERKPAAQVIREKLEQAVETDRPRETSQGLLALAELGKQLNLTLPSDVSTNIDTHLYQE